MLCLPLALVLSFLPQSSPATAARPEAQALDAGLVQKVDALAAEALAKPGGVGLSVAVARKGRILLEKGYGLADAEFDVQANAETLFRIGSVTKQFTAALVMLLVEQKKLALDDDLSKYVPDFPFGGRKVTIEQLLGHVSGVASYTDVGKAWQKLWPLELSDAEILALTNDKPFDFEPGSEWRYSNTGYYLLGMVIEKASGGRYPEELQKRICEPLGLTRTRYDSNHELIRNRAQGYAFESDRLANDIALGMSQPGAAGGIISTAGDLVRWQMALVSGKTVKPESFERMRKPGALPNGRNTHYGFGLGIEEWEGRPRVQHGGGIFGFNSMLFWLPNEDLHVAVISNGESISSGKLADGIAFAALGIERRAVVDEPIPAELITRLSGDFDFPDIGMQVKTFERDGKFLFQAKGQGAFRLLWQGGLEFRADFDNDVKVVFAEDGKSAAVYQRGKKADGKRK